MTLTRRLTLFTVVWCTCILALLNAVSIVWFRTQSINRLYQTLTLELNDVLRFNQQVPHRSLEDSGWESALLLIPSSVRFIDTSAAVTSQSMTPGFSAELLPLADHVWQQNSTSNPPSNQQRIERTSPNGRFRFADTTPPTLPSPHGLPMVSTARGSVIGVESPFVYPNNQPGRIVAVATLDGVFQEINQFEQSLFLADGAVVLLLAIGTYIVTRRGLRPLSQLMDQIQRVEWSSTSRIPVNNGPIEVTQLAGTINQQMERIESGIRQQRRFIADASHELRTPLAILAGHANLLRRWGATNPEVWQPAVRHITSEVERLQRLVDTLVMQSRLDGYVGHQAQDTTEAMLVRELIDQLMTDGQLLRADIDWTSDVKLPLRMVVNMPSDALRQAMIIVIDNAVCYTAHNGSIDISASVEERQIRIAVTDTGTGISGEDLPYIFDRFYRGSSSRNTQGSGLGLSICKQLVESVGGRIYVDSTLGKGTHVSLLLPVLEVAK